METITIDIPSDSLEVINRAADLVGISPENFIICYAIQEAKRIIILNSITDK